MATGSPSNSNLCNYCNLRPKHADASRTHFYCSTTCARTAKSYRASSNSITSSSRNSSNCDCCHTRSNGVQTHRYCSDDCAISAWYKKFGSKRGTCQTPNCTKPVHDISSIGEYCSELHRMVDLVIIYTSNFCLMCQQAPKTTDSYFCGQTCIDDAENNAPMILEVPQGHSAFESVSDQFKSSWRHSSKSCPPVKHMYKIINSQETLIAYNTYRDEMEARGQFVATGRSAGNENRRWHGTTRECTLGDRGQTQFCSSRTCSLCCIIKWSFDLSLFGMKTGWGRFGRGIYTSSTSSKSDDYSQNASRCSSKLKAILLNNVVVGRGCRILHDNTSLTAPPSGYDSVLAETGRGLNYDELVVYNNDAIRPSFLVMYEP
ncbi:hypothetical protein F5887DRAFT_80065 [Amanita rubescens]|nr:hypothetical protein F5887DRAFT_80065 [Amanita rubescens]